MPPASRLEARRHHAVSDILRARAETTSEREALVFLRDGETDAVRLTYADLDRKARAHATLLADAHPISDDDGPARVLLLHAPGVDFVAAFFGVLYAGLVPVPAYVPRNARGMPRLLGILEDSGASLVATTAAPADALEKAGGSFARLRRVLPPSEADEKALAGAWRERDADADACALLQYTSGSTSRPKGVVLRHGQLCANTAAIATAFATTPESVGVIWLPPYHDMGLIGGILHPIASGFPVVLMPPMAFLQRPARWLEAIARYRATISGGPNFAYDLATKKVAADQRSALDLGSWSTAFCGAEPIRAATLTRFADAFRSSSFSASSFVPCYGLAEATLLVTGAQTDEPPRIDEGPTRVVGCGPAAEGTRVVVVADAAERTACSEGVEGEIWVAGPGVAEGYFRDREATRATFDARLAGDPLRYLRTGDLGYLRDGALFVTGRTKELIIVRGRKLHPRDIEEAAQAAHPVLRAHGGAAFSSRDRIVLVQELERGARAHRALANVADAIRNAVSGALDVALDDILLVRAGTVPLTSSGKLQRAACRAAYEDGSIEVVFESSGDLADGLSSPTIAVASPVGAESPTAADRVASILRVEVGRLTPDIALTALGLDSLAAVEVQSFLRAAGADASVDELLAGVTWGVLERRVERAIAAPPTAGAIDLGPVSSRARTDEAASYVESAAIAHSRARPESAALNVAVAGWVLGSHVDRRALENAVRALEARHDALRTTFEVDSDGTVLRRVSSSPRTRIEVLACDEASVTRALADHAATPFDMGGAPLFRVVVAEVGSKIALLFCAHHAIVDLASLEVLLRDLGALYARELGDHTALLRPPVQASDAASMERGFVDHEAEAVARRWEERLPHPLPVLDVPRAAPRRRAPLRPAGLVRFEVSEAATAGIKTLARATSSSTFTILLATYHLVLHHWSGQADLVVGCETAGRTRAELMDIVGSFARPLPIRASVDGEKTFAEAASALRGAVLGALEDQAYPFLAILDRLVKKGATFEPDAPPVFQAVFNFTRDRDDSGLAAVALGRSGATISAGPLRLRTIGLPPAHAHSEIALLAAAGAAGDTLDLAILHDAELYEAPVMERFASDFAALLARAVAAPETKIEVLLAELPRRRVPVRVAANFTATPIEPSLKHWLELAGLPPTISSLPYDGLLTALHDGSLRGPGANVLLVRPESLARGAHGVLAPALDAALARNVDVLLDALGAFGQSPPPPTVLAVTPAEDDTHGVLAARERILSWAREQPWLSTLDLSDVVARFDVREPFDRDAMLLGDAPLSDTMAAATGAAAARSLRCALVPAKKVVVVDADGTLWGGVAAEDGPHGVRVDGPYAELQRRLVTLRDAGMLVALVSKNVEADVEAVFDERREMPLTRAHLVALRASWAPKADVVRALAAQLELGLDAFVFIDDNPVECAAMRAACPEVLVVELPDRAEAIPRRLDAVWELDRPRATEEDRRRARMYRDEAGRASERAQASSLADFLASLDLVVEITPMAPGDVPRAAQLTQRTNQLNTTTRRMTEADVAARRDAWVVRVRDRFGDYGLVGVVLLDCANGALAVPLLLLSCRALGRGVEARIVTWLGGRARDCRAERVVFAYARTARNEPARRMLEALGGATLGDDVASVVVSTDQLSLAAARVMPSETTTATTREPATSAPPGGSRLLDASIACDRADALVAALSSGRRRRRSTPARPLEGTESVVAAVWSEVLGLDGIDSDDDFFALGGTSLQALAVVARLRRSLGAELDVAVVFERPRLGDFARAAAAAAGPNALERAENPHAVDEGAPVPATAMQRRLWLLYRVDPTDPAYHVPFAARIAGTVDPDAWNTAFAALVRRHEALRMRFVSLDDEPYLVVGDGSDVVLEMADIATTALDGWMTERIQKPFDLERGPLARAYLAKLAHDEHVLLVVLHHAVADGTSLGTLVRELARGVQGEAITGNAPSWLAYARAEAARDPAPSERASGAARASLAGIEPLEIPIARPDSPGLNGGAVTVHVLHAGRAAAVRDLARALATTSFTVLLAAYGAVLGRLAGRDDIALAIPVSVRDDARWQRLVGPLVNTVVARIPLDGAPDARVLVTRAHEAAQAAYARAALPFEKLVAALVPDRDPTRTPLVQAMIVEQPSASSLVPAGGPLRIEPIAVTSGGAQLDLGLAVSHEPGGAIRLALEYRKDRVSAEGAAAFLERLENVLAAMTEAPTRSIASIALVTDDERRRVLGAWAGPTRPYATDEGLARAFERQVDRAPDALAVTSDEGTFTYAELDHAANRLAHALLARGVRRGDRVGIALPRSRALVAAIHACLKIGAPYVPLEPDLPAARVTLMAADAGIAAVVTDATSTASLRAGSLVAVDVMGDTSLPSGRPDVDVRGGDLAYVLYTSGSTGKPKGVMVEHAGVQNRLGYQQEVIDLRPGEAVLHKTPYGFDVSVWELLWPLRVGAHLVVAPPGAHRDPDALVGLIASHGITTVHFVPSMLGAFVEADGLERLTSLTRVFTSGEALPHDTVARLRARLPRVAVHNFYGPTEASIEVTHFAVPEGPVRAVPIGRPIANTRIYVVDAHGALLPPGAVGELWISGIQVARGYLGDEVRTREAFASDPFVPGTRIYRTGDLARFRGDGIIDFLGRKDRQVKIRGNRIELSEIETALRAHVQIDAAVVVAREGRLVAYVVGANAAEDELRAHLAKTLPDAMIPTVFMSLPELPLGISGKIAVDRLPDPPRIVASTGDAASTDAERALAEVWSNVLGVDGFGRDADFFALGGDSILALKVVSRARARGLLLHPRDVFERPTLRGLATRAEPHREGADGAPRVEAGQRAPLLPMQAAFFTRHPPGVRDRFCQSIRLVAATPIEAELLARAIDVVAEAHPALATRFECEGDRVIAQVRPAARPSGVARVAMATPGEDAHERAIASIRASGPLVAATVEGTTAILVVHHAVIDAVSWHVMLADLAAAYAALAAGRTPEARAADSTFTWAAALATWSRGDAARVEAEAWRSRLAPLPASAYGSGLEGPAGRAGDADVHAVHLDRATTTRLFALLRATFREVDEAISGALAVALDDLALPASAPDHLPQHTVRVLDIERHGRDTVLGTALDLPRAVGWLTSLFPVAVRSSRTRDPRATLEAAREAFAIVPNQGVGFGALDVTLPPRDVVVNYVGVVTGGDDVSGLRFAEAGGDRDRHADGPRDHVLEVVAQVNADGELSLRFGYPRSEHNARLVARAAARTLGELGRLASEIGDALAVSPREDVHVPALVQQGILVESARSPSERGTYVEQLAIDVHGPIDAARLRQAWEAVVARHPALRSAFVAGLVVVLPAAEVLARGVFETLAIAPGGDALEAWLDADRARGFDTGRAPLLRVTLLARGEARTMVLTHHHAIADGWCIPLLLGEALTALRGEDLGPPPPPYREVVRWLDQQDRAGARAHFRQRLAGIARATPPPRDRALVSTSTITAPRRTIRRSLAPHTMAAMARLAREAGVTTSTVALAAYALTLGRMTGEARVVFAVTVHGRPADLANAESMVGVLIQTLPFVVETAGDEDVRRWLGDVQANLLLDQTHAHVGLAAIKEEEPAAAFESLFVVENYPLETPEDTCGLTFGAPRIARQMRVPFAFVVLPSTPAAEIDIDPSRVSEDDGRDFLERYVFVLEALAGAPAARVRQVGVLSPDERAHALALANPPPTTRADLDARTLHGRFLAAADESPSALAVTDGRRSLTYAELSSAARALATRLGEAGVARGDLVGIVADAGTEQIAGVLGVLFSGAAFVPLDPAYPEARLGAMTEAAQPSAMVATARTASLARRIAGASPVLSIDFDAPHASAPLLTTSSALAQDRAYVLFTSGSTGRPKGVMCHHAGVEALVDDLDARAPLSTGANASHWTSPSFDVSVWEIFAALTRGAALHVVPAAIRADARALVTWLDDQRIASAYLPGFALEALAERVEAGGCRALRRLLVGVEPIASALLDQVLAHAPDLVVVNGYGPTEASVCATLHTAARHDTRTAIVPIGRAVKGARVYVLDDRMEPLPPRVPGEIFVAGVGVAQGYIEEGGASATRFSPDPFAPAHSRMYRTGDRAIALDDGTLLFLGRRDQQVKVRGVRVEVGEVEATLARLSFVREGAVLAVESTGGTTLVAAVALREGDGPRVRAELRNVLPDAMVPSRVVELESLPRDPNGKIDRSALRAAVDASVEVAPTGRLSPTAEILAGLVGELLGVRPRQDDDFLAIGGDSLSATRLAGRIRDSFAVALPLSAVFEAKSIADLASRIDGARTQVSARAERALVAAGENIGPTSFAQERLLFIDRLDPGNPVYNLACTARLQGPLDRAVLRRALVECVRRHGALRTVFGEVGGRTVQHIRETTDILRDEDVTDVRGDHDPLARALVLAADDARRPFDLARGPLFRARLYVLGNDDHAIALGLHHVVADGWSLRLVLEDVLALYEAFVHDAPSPLAELPIQYVDFARWQREKVDDERTAELVRFWTARLAGAPPLLDLPADFRRPDFQSFRGGHVRFTLGEDLVRRVDAAARRAGATSAMVLLAALDALLVRWSGSTDVSVGVSLANRRQHEIEPLVGFFVNLVVVRAELTDRLVSFDTLLRHVRERSLEAYDHQDLHFDRLVDELRPRRTLAHSPLFQVNFVYDDAPHLETKTALAVTPLDVDTKTARFDLALSLLRDGGRIVGALEYNGDVFARRTAERMASSFEHLLAAAVDDPRAPIEALPLGEPAQPAVQPRSTTGARPRFVRAFEDAVDAAPGALALVSRAPGSEAAISYAELDRRSSHLAHVLRAAGVGRDVVVGVCAPRSIAAVVSILAILRAGGAFLPLDPDVPLTRLAAIVESARPGLVLTTEDAADLVPADAANVLVLEEVEPAPPGPVARPTPLADATDDDLAYVIYTSGSTGTPNGVAVVHRGLSNLAVAQARAFGIDRTSRVLQFASLGFDASVSEIATTLASGATLDLGAGTDRTDVAESLRHVTIATLPPSLLAALDPAAYPALATVVSAGEALPADVARRWIDAKKRLINAYGPTEATVCATLGDVSASDLEEPRGPTIGHPMDGVRVHVLDARRVPVPLGVVGEIAIGGAGVARGYLGRPEITDARFVPDPFSPGERLFLTGDRARLREDGRIEFGGRIDEQLKVRGHRVEAGDVEACLRRHSSVSDAAIVVAGDTKRLVAYVVPVDPSAAPAPEELVRFVAARLPRFMVPDRVAILESLPLTTSGKVDSRALAAREDAHEAPAALARLAPRNHVETVLAHAFAEVLRLTKVGVHDNFFDLGGDSIASIQVAARARRGGVAFAVKDLFLKQTVAELAAIATEIAAPVIVDAPAEGNVPLTPIQRWFFEQRSPDIAYYNQSVLLEIDTPVVIGPLREAARAVTVAHDALRLRFEPAALDGGDSGELSWQQRYGEAEGSIAVDTAPASELAAARHRAHRGLDLAHGPVARIVLFDGKPSRLLVVVHHLVIDAVSLRVLVTDLLTAYAGLAAGSPAALPPKTASYKAWAGALFDPALDLAAERRVLDALERGRTRLPTDGRVDGTDTRAAARTVVTELSVADTTDLEKKALPALGATVEQALLTCLGMALAPALRGGAIVVDVEGHGRDVLDADRPIDVTRTVGWFTSVSPVRVDTASAADVRTMLRGVKESLAAVPRAGAGFGVLGYAGSGEIGLNYLGRVDRALTEGIRLVDDHGADDQSPRTPRPSAIEVQAMIVEGRLRVSWTYLEARHGTATIEAWAQALLRALRAMTAGASPTTAPVYATDDFPEAGLTADELASVLGELEETGEP